MFTSSPRFAKLPQQVAATLERQIAKGTMRDGLPGERGLALSLQVSRRTIRLALEILRRKGVLKTVQGHGTRTTGVRPPQPQAHGSIGLLLPAPLDQMRPHTTIFIDALRILLAENNLRLQEHVGPRYYSGRPGAALLGLTGQYGHDGWILSLSNAANQAWFADRRLPTVVSGTAHLGIALAAVDVDQMATSRHAAQHLARKGHTRIALLIEDSQKAGDRLAEEGFLVGAKTYAAATLLPSINKHQGTAASIGKLVSRLMNAQQPPTALFIADPYHYLAAASALAKLGLRVPEDVSLMCRDDDLFLQFLATEPCRYACSPTVRANALFAALMAAIQQPCFDHPRQTLLMPEFCEGISVARLGPFTGPAESLSMLSPRSSR